MLPVETLHNTNPREKDPDELTGSVDNTTDEAIEMEEPDLRDKDELPDSDLHDEE